MSMTLGPVAISQVERIQREHRARNYRTDPDRTLTALSHCLVGLDLAHTQDRPWDTRTTTIGELVLHAIAFANHYNINVEEALEAAWTKFPHPKTAVPA